MRISILCSIEHLNVLTNAIWVTKIQKIFQQEKHCHSAARSFCAIHGCKSPPKPQFGHLFRLHKAVAVGCVAISRWFSRWGSMLWSPSSTSPPSPPPSCLPPFALSRCFRPAASWCLGFYVVLRDLSRQTLRQAGCITAIMKSVSADCTQGLAELQLYLSSHTEEGGDAESWAGGRWATKIGRDLECACARVCVWAIKNCWMKRCVLLGWQEVQTRSRQPQPPCSDQPGLNRILMCTGSWKGGRGGVDRGGVAMRGRRPRRLVRGGKHR